MDCQTAHDLLTQLEDRLSLCEAAVGEGEVDDATRTNNDAAAAAATTTTTNDDGRTTNDEGRTNNVAGVTLCAELAELTTRANAVMRGPLLEVERYYNRINNYLEAEHADISSLFLNMRAKRGYLLHHQQFLRTTAEQLKQFDQLRHCVNPLALSDIENHQRRLKRLDGEGSRISEATLKLSREMQELASVYNTTMNMLSALFMQWDAIVKEKEQGEEQAEGTEKQQDRGKR
eukprot:GHVS01080125.1.p1 GENE.GHVS01080125.1~~GHVS01080125.1.p1  ORF type:complete len:232 (+),score=71.76 GHVS01080125.1:300-995(+)